MSGHLEILCDTPINDLVTNHTPRLSKLLDEVTNGLQMHLSQNVLAQFADVAVMGVKESLSDAAAVTSPRLLDSEGHEANTMISQTVKEIKSMAKQHEEDPRKAPPVEKEAAWNEDLQQALDGYRKHAGEIRSRLNEITAGAAGNGETLRGKRQNSSRAEPLLKPRRK